MDMHACMHVACITPSQARHLLTRHTQVNVTLANDLKPHLFSSTNDRIASNILCHSSISYCTSAILNRANSLYLNTHLLLIDGCAVICQCQRKSLHDESHQISETTHVPFCPAQHFRVRTKSLITYKSTARELSESIASKSTGMSMRYCRSLLSQPTVAVKCCVLNCSLLDTGHDAVAHRSDKVGQATRRAGKTQEKPIEMAKKSEMPPV